MKHILLIAFILGNISGLFAQQVLVTGQVLDQQSREGLAGVTLSETGTQNGTVSDSEGKFSLTVSEPEASIKFSLLGYGTQVISLQGRTSLILEMKEAEASIDDVVITALGLERQNKALGYVVQKLDGEAVASVKSPNFVDDLAGKVAGVTISQGATGVGSSSKITIRGEASFSNNNPLFVVDGTPINNNSILNFTNEAAAGFQEIDFGNGGMEVNADDVESVTVLKGPAAAALYGTRASNGVIIITTKSGARHKGWGVSVNSSTLMDKPFQLPKFQNKYGQGNSGQFEFVNGLGAGVNDNISYSWGPALDQGLLIAQFDSPVTMPDGSTVRGGDVAVHGGRPITPTPFISHPNNLRDFYNTGWTTTNNVAISSGFDQGDFRLSFSDMRSASIIPGVNLDRNNLAAHLNFRPMDRLKVNASVNYVNSRSENRPANGYGSENINYSLVAWGPRNMDIANLEDFWQPGLENVQQYSFNYTYFDNPYFILLENRNAFTRDRIFGNLQARYEFTDHLSLSLRSGMDYSNELRSFRRAFSSNRFQKGAYAEHTVGFRENNTDFLLNYNRDLQDFGLDVSLGGNRMDQQASTVQTQALSLAQAGIFNLSNAASPLEVFQYRSRKRINSLYGLVKLSYKDYLFLDLTGRNDWSSALATPGSTSSTGFFYPSASASFVLSNLISLPKAISFAKVRASWAAVGNDTDPYLTTTAFVAQTPYNSQPTFSAQSIIANANLLPERTACVELGADLRFLDDRIRLDVTWYNSLTQNQILSLPVALSSGYSQKVVNGGAVRSVGLEVIAGLVPIRTDQFTWTSTLNFSRNVSTVVSLPEQAGRLTLAYNRVYDNVNQTVWYQVEEGSRIGDMYGTGYLKNEDGQFVVDANGNFIVDNNLKLLGNYNPDFILGFNNDFRWKNWNLSFLFDWRQGGVLVSRTLALAGVGGQLIETEDRPAGGIVADGVVNTGTASEPVYVPNTVAISAESYYRQYYDRNHEENNVYDASYCKMRQFSLGYTFQGGESGFLRNGRTLSIAFIGRNLFALSHIPHFDPEQLAVQGNKFISGVEDMSYPTTRSLGVKVGFEF
ncbi:MAG: SusC/RagA family TonB-linked outer membrane protein [Bacteroidia bacterium]|nr:SusC/RagA family TonB-linked outer membrane protein [Bacteroidia bacterium]